MAELDDPDAIIAPLFDRLRVAKSADEPQPLRTLNRDERRESVRQELSRLVNTRSPTPADRFATAELTVVDYGLPDCSALSLRNSRDRERLGFLVARAVTAFEPRLHDVTAAVEVIEGSTQTFRVTVQAMLFSEPITVALVLPHRGSGHALVDVHVRPPATAS